MTSAIVVRTRDPEKKGACFIAIPYSSQYQGLSRVLDEAALRADLVPHRVDRSNEESTFPQDVLEGIRAARLVVAACGPDERAGGLANLNVLYELGIAHALGKPAIILAPRGKAAEDLTAAIPADLAARHLLTYDEGEIQNGALAARVEARIRATCQKMSEKRRSLTDPNDAAVSESRHWSVAHPESWELFLAVVQFAKRVHNVFQEFDVFLADARREIEDIIRQPEIGLAGGITIGNKWRAILKHYRSMPRQNLLGRLEAILKEVDLSFDRLMAERSSATDRLTACKEPYEILKKKLTDYLPLADELERQAADPRVFTERSEEGAARLLLLVVGLSDQTTSLAVEADNLLLTLINVLSGD